MGPSGATPGSQTNSPGLSAAGAVSAGLESLAPQNGMAAEGAATRARKRSDHDQRFTDNPSLTHRL